MRRTALVPTDPEQTFLSLGLVLDPTLGRTDYDLCFTTDDRLDSHLKALARYREMRGKPAKYYRVDRKAVYLR